MVKQSSLLADLQLGIQCPADWDQMIGGNDHVRHCPTCRRDVHNLSVMTSQEAEAILKRQEQGRVCVRFARRADGRVVTRDSHGQGRGTAGKFLVLVGALLMAFLFSMLVWPVATARPGSREEMIEQLRRHDPLKTVVNWLWPPPPPEEDGCVIGADW
jgi:hypothetical protein